MITTALSWSIEAEADTANGRKSVTETMNVTIDGTNLQSLISSNGYTTNNVTFTLSGDNSMSYNSSNKYVSMGTVSKSNKNFSIALRVPANYTIESINSVSVRAVGYTSAAWDNISLTVDGGSQTNIRTISVNPQNSDNNYTTVTSSNISSKSNVGLAFISSANNKYIYIRKVVIELKVSTFYDYSAIALPNNDTYGNTSAEVTSADITGTLSAIPASTTATFTATPSSGYEFAGWGETADAAIYESTANPYYVTLENSAPGSTVSKTLYAIFKPVFRFEVSATTNNNELGTATASVDNAKMLGAPDDTDAQTTATFIASPASDCLFKGWYEAADYSGTPVSGDPTYIFTLNNNSVGSTTSKTLYALFKKKQNLQWATPDLDLNLVSGQNYSSAATVTSGKTITYTSDNHNAVTIDADGTIHAVGLGDAVITASVEGDDTYDAETITRNFSVGEIKQATFTPAWGEGTSADIKVEGSTSIALTNIANDETFTISATPEGIISWSREGNTLTISAVQAGSTTLTLSQQGSAVLAGNTAIYDITVSKLDNTLSMTLDDTEVEVDGTISLVVADRISDGATHAHISDQQLSSEVNNGTDVITCADGVITARNAGTAKIRFTQDATAKYAAYESDTYIITVNKLSNTITVTLDGEEKNSKNVGRGASVALGYSSPSDASYSITRTSGSDDIATISGNTIHVGTTDGTIVWEIAQAETYKYEAATASVRIKVNSVAEEEGYVFVGYTGQEETSVEFELSGPGKDIYLGARKSGVGTTTIQVRASASDDWVTVKEFDTKYSLSGCEPYSFFDIIPEDARYVRIYGSGSIHHFADIKVTRKTYVRATASITNLGEVYTDKTASATFNVSYSTTNGGDIEVLSNNPCFTVDKITIPVANNSDNVTAPVVVTVTYTPDPDHLGDDEGTVTIADRYYSTELTFTAFAKKYPTTLSRGSNTATETTVDGTIDNAFAFTGTSATAPTASSVADFYFTIASTYSSDVHTDDGVITYDPATNTVTGRNAGTARLTIYQKSTHLYTATSQTFEFSVSRLPQTLTWDHEVETTMQVGSVIDNNTATSDVGLTPVTYTSSNTAAIEVDGESGRLTAKAVGANITITATQAGNYKYAPATITRQFSVFNKQTPAFTPDEAHYDSDTKTITVDWEGTATITVTGVGADAEAGFTITHGDDAVIRVERNDATITIFGLTIGQTTLTLAQAASDDFLAKSETYTVNVVMPTDYLTLDPAEEPHAEAGTYRKITLNRTLKAGYSTIALPFDVTVGALVGDRYNAETDWVAQLSIVAYNARDGYSLYFRKSAEIAANAPYILHLAEAVVGPVLAGTIEVFEASATEHAAESGVNADSRSYLDWSMHSNYTPAFDMEGKYGVVNAEGVLRLGAAGSTLSALSAYIAAPAAAAGSQKVATQFVTDAEFTAVIEQIACEPSASEATSVYDLSGRALSTASSPVFHIVNGRKVMRK